MSHRDPVSHNNGLASSSEAGMLPDLGAEAEHEPASGALKGSIPKGIINGASKVVIALPLEIGGRDGPEPTRYGDWEKAGRCIDF